MTAKIVFVLYITKYIFGIFPERDIGKI